MGLLQESKGLQHCERRALVQGAGRGACLPPSRTRTSSSDECMTATAFPGSPSLRHFLPTEAHPPQAQHVATGQTEATPSRHLL